MKKLVCVFLTSFMGFLLCSCSNNNTIGDNDVMESTPKITEHNSNLSLTMTEHETGEKETAGKRDKVLFNEAPQKSGDNNETTDCITNESVTDYKALKEYRKENNGMVLSVIVPEKIEFGKDFTLVAKVLNNTSENISYTLPSITPNMHFEIKVKISNGNILFTDCDTFNKPFEQLEKTAVLPVGETLEQTMTFLPGTAMSISMNEEDVTMFNSGIYSGTAEFCWNVNGGTEKLLLEFPVEII